MARSLFRAFRGEAPAARPAAPVRRSGPSASQLRRERRFLLRLRDERLRDLGGLVVEMYRQESVRENLLLEHAAEVAALEERIRELDLLLGAVGAAARATVARCACGAPLHAGERFCGHCGRAVAARAPARRCASCDHSLAADAAFCGACGTPVPATEQ